MRPYAKLSRGRLSKAVRGGSGTGGHPAGVRQHRAARAGATSGGVSSRNRPGLLGWVGRADLRATRAGHRPHVRKGWLMSNLATADRLRPATSQLTGVLVLRSLGLRSGTAPAARPRSRLRRARADGAQSRRLPRARVARQRAGARPQCRRRRAPVEHLPAPAGDHAQGPRQRRQHRLPDPSLDLRPQGRAPRRAALRRQAVPEPGPEPAAELERPAVRRPARRQRGPGDPGRARLRLLQPRARPRRDPRVQLQLEDLHRGLPRGLPRRAVPPGPRQLRHLRGPEVGVRAVGVAADGRRHQPAQGRDQDLRALAEGGARLLPRRDAQAGRDLARPTTRTS